ncbi:Pyroglutamyl peptidase OS=Streptomyces chartreusis OX=1969 GN=CP983_30025 PE=4 SV=1 [Streptomyces chartreusis]
MNSIRVRIGVLGLALLAGLSAPTTGTAAAAGAQGAPPTVEEQRLDRAVPQEILRRSGFDAPAARFARDLGAARSYAQARHVVERTGSALWRRAVDRAQGRGRPGVTSAGTTIGRCTGRGCR